MQLNKPRSIRAALAAATCTALSQPVHAEQDSGEWKVDSGVLFYSEADGRINVTAPEVNVTTTKDDSNTLTLRGVYDTITGASPNGATPTSTPQTFTSPSGNSSYTTPAGETPMREITDTRYAVGIDWEHELSRMVRNSLSANFSTESDYLSLGVSDSIKVDVNNRRTTLTAGAGVTMDTISPGGGAPVGLQLLSASVPAAGGEGEDGEDGEDGEHKLSTELLFGVTHILSRRALMQLNYSYNYSDGYLTDPYKVLSVIDGTSGATLDYRYEKRPSTRQANSIYWKLNYHLPEDVLYLSYRYFWDDWDITSHTVDIKYRAELGGSVYLQPHIRLYEQSAASFYHHSLVDGDPLPAYASADLRLGKMTSTTVGLKLGMTLGEGQLSLRYETMTQEGDSHPADAIGIQQNYDLYPTLDAHIIQLGYSFKF